jgi:AraC-like DNA-binding protein
MEKKLRIIGQIYDVPSGNEEWSDPLNGIADYCGMESTALVIVDNKLEYASVNAPRADPDVIAAYNDKWWEFDPTVKATRSKPVGRLTSLLDTGHDEFLSSTFHHEFWSRSGLGAERVATNLILSENAFVSCVMHASVQHDKIDQMTLRRFAVFVPHLIRATRLQRQIQRLQAENTLLGIFEEAGQTAVMVVAADGRLIYANEKGERMLATDSGIGLHNHRIELSRQDAQMNLMQAVLAASRKNSSPAVNSPVCLPRDDKQLVIDIRPSVPALHATGLFEWHPAAILRIREGVVASRTPERHKKTFPTQPAPTNRSRFAAIKQDIRQNITNLDLSLDWLAKRHSVAPRTIRNYFYAEDTNFTDWLMNARLDCAREMLVDRDHEHANIAWIAFECGFGDLSWFHHVFKRRFNMTPGQMRAQG